MPVPTIKTALLHGGDLNSASKASSIPRENWLDLSTGISPYAYPFNPLPMQAFTDLPYLGDNFFEQVRAYYGSQTFLPVPGTQATIQAMPDILPNLPVLLPSLGYQEHLLAWQQYGSQIRYYDALDSAQALEEIEKQLQQNPSQHLLVINPNNPTTLSFSTTQLVAWANKLTNGACLIVDEAFIDSYSNATMIPYLSENTIVLRSFGKFFGLAGIRLGFVFAGAVFLSKLQERLALWAINGPAAHIAEQALADRDWQNKHLSRLACTAEESIALLQVLACNPACRRVWHEHLFSSFLFEKTKADTLFQHFFEAGILVRQIPVSAQESLIRIGRHTEKNTARLLSALRESRV